ncbi:MAG: hypothetical protein ACYTEZ_02790 [Planctomycetota bacterium]|jgi:hypothetical protein
MRALPFLLLVLILVPAGLAAPGEKGVVSSEEFNFEISMPPNSIDWENVPPPKDKARQYVKAHFRTEYADTNPPSSCDVQLIVVPLNKLFARKKLAYAAMKWEASMEANLSNKRDVKEGEGTLGGQKCYYRDVKGEYIAGIGHISWCVARMGNHLYVFHVMRTYKAVGDEALEAEVAEIRSSFKFLKEIKVKAHKEGDRKGAPPDVAGPGGGGQDTDRVDPEKIKRETIKLSHWRFECVKPQGMLNIDPKEFDKSETSNHMVAKFERVQQQSRLLIRIFAQSAQAQKYTLDQLAESKIKFFNQIYKKHRLEPEIDKKYKFPLAKKAIKMKLVGRRGVPETTLWVLAQCKNDRQYQLYIYTTGSTGEQIWKKQIDDFLKNFKPLKK